MSLTVTTIEREKVAAGTVLTFEVDVRNDGATPFAVDPSAWALITGRGEQVALEPTAGNGLVAGDLDPGGTQSGSLAGVVRAAVDDAFITYTDASGTLRFAVPANGS